MEKHESKKFKLYTEAIAEIKTLTPKEEKELFTSYGNPKTPESEKTRIRDLIIVSNLRLVLKIANEYRRKGLELEDLVSEGNLGLFHAIDKYRVNDTAKFSTYASWWIKQRLHLYYHKHIDTVRLPVKKRKISNKNLLEEGGESLLVMISMDEYPYMADRDLNMASPEDIMGKREETIALMNAIMELNDDERKIISMRYGIRNNPKTLREISKEFNLTKERIRQIQVDVIKKIKSKKIIRELL